MSKTARIIQDRQTTLAKGRKVNRYTDKFREAAIALVENYPAGSLHQRVQIVARQVKMPSKTLRRWMDGLNKEVEPEVKAQVLGDIRDLFEQEMHDILQEMKSARKDASYRDLAIGLGIVFDKLQLLNGKSTANIQQQVAFIRTGLSSIPEHLTPRAIEDNSGDEPL